MVVGVIKIACSWGESRNISDMGKINKGEFSMKSQDKKVVRGQ